jgi:outer membrane protein
MVPFAAGTVCAQVGNDGDDFQNRLDGDIGVGGYYTRSIVRGKSVRTEALPYAYFDYGRAFARIDTFGIKTFKVGYGHLELSGRVSLDGFKANSANLRGLNDRKDPIPLGIGTLQETPYGAVFVNAFHDVGKSNGNLLELIYAGQFESARMTFYPQIGAERLSGQYVNHLYGVSAREAIASQYAAYQGGNATNPFIAMLIDKTISDDWHLNIYARHKWLSGSIQDSPIVGRKGMDSAFAALSYRFR